MRKRGGGGVVFRNSEEKDKKGTQILCFWAELEEEKQTERTT
jgi:hypothetical protein